MSQHTLSEFADEVNRIMPVIMKEFMSYHSGDLYRAKVTFPQAVILALLNDSKESRMTDIAKAIKVSTAAMTGMVDRLVRDGYVSRHSDPVDRRIVRIRLTGKGGKLMDKIESQKKKMVVDIFGKITEREREEYLNILTHIHENIISRKDS